jgi:hypothetical protein
MRPGERRAAGRARNPRLDLAMAAAGPPACSYGFPDQGGNQISPRGGLQLVSGLHLRHTSAPASDPTRNWTVFSFSNCMSTPCPDEGSCRGTT